jgi:hypothetical protein
MLDTFRSANCERIAAVCWKRSPINAESIGLPVGEHPGDCVPSLTHRSAAPLGEASEIHSGRVAVYGIRITSR